MDNNIEHASLHTEKFADSIRILLLEDAAADAELNELELKKAGIPFTTKRVETREDFLAALHDFAPEIIVADYQLPQFSAMEALELLKQQPRDIPFILVTGSQSEEVAVECLKEGADDYILKQSLRRLPSALIRALEKKEAERNKEKAEQQLRASIEELHALSAHLQSVREEERARIAREIHDELGQTLTALRLDLAWLQNKLSAIEAEQTRQLLEPIREMSKLVDTTIQTVRRISTELRPRVLDELGLLPALEWQTEEFQNHTGIHCTFFSNVDDIHLDQHRATAIFRILQESLTNVIRHANATEVTVRLRVSNGQLKLTVEDNGKGIAKEQTLNLRSFGILGMKERAHLLGGNVSIAPRDAGGTVVAVELPLKLGEHP